MNKLTDQSQAANVSDTTFAREIWRLNSQGNLEGIKVVRDQWKHIKELPGYANHKGPLTIHEITAFAEKNLQAHEGDAICFARAIERAVLIKAYTLLPELRQAEEAKHHRRYFRDGLDWGLVAYNGAILEMAIGRPAVDPESDIPAKPGKPRAAKEAAKLERVVDADIARSGFEAWAGQRQFDLRREGGSYVNIVTAYTWMGWIGHAQESACNQARKGGANA